MHSKALVYTGIYSPVQKLCDYFCSNLGHKSYLTSILEQGPGWVMLGMLIGSIRVYKASVQPEDRKSSQSTAVSGKFIKEHQRAVLEPEILQKFSRKTTLHRQNFHFMLL